MMSLDEMKLAVCEKLPELIHILHDGYDHIEIGGEHIEYKPRYKCFYNGKELDWSMMGLQVCHEAEKVLGDSHTYASILGKICMPHYAIRATYEQRLEALCRVWWPERFE